MSPFEAIWDRAVERHGEEGLRARFPHVSSPDRLRALRDDRFLSAMTQRVFAAGFRWKVIQAKWDGFEEAFHGFDVDHVADLDAAGIDALAQDTRIVRNRPKILSTVENAAFVRDTSREHGSFGAWIANWPEHDVVGLWEALKKGGSRLGGDTGSWFLRMVGKDTFRLSGDTVAALVEAGVATKKPTGKKALREAGAQIHAWAEEAGISQGAVSVVLACSTGEVYDGAHR